MSPKKVPVRIGLTKKPTDDISDLMPARTMEALEDIVDLVEQALSDEDELPDLDISDKIDCDVDPDYVPDAVPSTSTTTKGKRLVNKPFVLPKRSLHLVSQDHDTEAPANPKCKGRSNAPIWKYFNVSDRKIAGGQIEKGAESSMCV